MYLSSLRPKARYWGKNQRFSYSSNAFHLPFHPFPFPFPSRRGEAPDEVQSKVQSKVRHSFAQALQAKEESFAPTLQAKAGSSAVSEVTGLSPPSCSRRQGSSELGVFCRLTWAANRQKHRTSGSIKCRVLHPHRGFPAFPCPELGRAQGPAPTGYGLPSYLGSCAVQGERERGEGREV